MGAVVNAAQAVQSWLSGFSIPAYAAAAVPSDADFPYLTYELVIGELYGGEVNMPVNLWYHGDSEAAPNAKARELYHDIGIGGRLLPCDGGCIWVKRGSPWCQSVVIEGEDEHIKRRYINVNLEYLTTS